MDQIDYQIIELLKINGKLSNTELSKQLYISSQAIGKRRMKLEALNLISNYTIDSLVYKTAFIEVYMNNSNFKQFEQAIKNLDYHLELHKITGSYCYLIKYDQLVDKFDDSLDQLVAVIEGYARYKINISSKRI